MWARLGRRIRAPALGLRWRMALWVGAVLLLAFAVIFVVVYRDTGSQIRSQISREVASEVRQLASALRPAAQRSPASISATGLRYLRGQPFTSNSPLLFVLVPGARPASNHPEVFTSEPAEPGETAAEQAQENRASRTLQVPRPGYSTLSVADAGRMALLERRIRLGRVVVVVGAGEPLATVEVAEHGVARAFLLAGVLVLVLALIASYLAAARVSAPLRGMAAVAARADLVTWRRACTCPRDAGRGSGTGRGVQPHAGSAGRGLRQPASLRGRRLA